MTFVPSELELYRAFLREFGVVSDSRDPLVTVPRPCFALAVQNASARARALRAAASEEP